MSLIQRSWNAVKGAARSVYESGKKLVAGGVAVGAGVLGFGQEQAHAALAPEITAGFASVGTSFGELLAEAYPLMITITTGLVIFGMVKMFIHKSAGK